MRVNYFAFSFLRGGAAIAAEKFYYLGSRNFSVRSFCVEELTGDDRREAPAPMAFRYHYFLRLLEYCLLIFVRKDVDVKHSINLFSCRLVRDALQSCFGSDEIVHLHWINNDTLSLWDLAKVPPYSIITLHDEWLIAGAEHYQNPFGPQGALDGYSSGKLSLCKLVNKYCWFLKYKLLSQRKDLIVTAPSNWLCERAAQSPVLAGNQIELLPNPIDTEVFAPLLDTEKQRIRNELGIGAEDFVLVFGGVALEKNRLKGGAELEQSLVALAERLPKDLTNRITLLVFGGDVASKVRIAGFRTVHCGRVSSPEGMQRTYGAGDFTVVPSQVEAFGQVAAESLSCGVPVICFDTSGLRDVVQHEVSGFVADFLSVDSLAVQIERAFLLGKADRSRMGRNGRSFIEKSFSFEKVEEAYLDLLNRVHSRKTEPLGQNKRN
ncbi:glycosyltransferase [Marinobacter sp.]|uniref:glycosyltransferase n=1 Tax=Marinobacter sp. TaxID=50741 RepID=UPI002352A1AA|nr:glycosyltransferase [Marinobacter sp.]